MNNQFKITYQHPVEVTQWTYDEITQPEQVHAMKTKLTEAGFTSGSQITLEVDCTELEEQLMNNRFYDWDHGVPAESSNDYTAYLMQMHIDDQVFEIEPDEISNHPIYEVFKKLEQHFYDPKVIFDNGLKFTAKLC
ncbi:hypothetical protein [Paenibacillus sp. DYY-L-2]|uniref:hypothetical protein n=1 Tax=Paenibacillus sp. DYY-L-2 TaxID=3447013 RepID=UPI003F505A59